MKEGQEGRRRKWEFLGKEDKVRRGGPRLRLRNFKDKGVNREAEGNPEKVKL